MSHEQIQYLACNRIDDEEQLRKVIRRKPLGGLAKSMQEVGQLDAIRLRRDGERLIVVNGHRRLEAARLLGWEKIAVIIDSKELSEGERRQRQLISNCQREDNSPYEVAAETKLLMENTGWSASQVAEKLGFSNSKVTRLLSLLTLPKDIQAQVASGAIPASAAYELAQVTDSSLQAEMAARLAAGEITRDAATSMRKRKAKSNGETAPGKVSRVTAVLGDGRIVTLAGPDLQSLDVLIQWLELLLAKARKFRPQGLAIQTFAKMLKDQAKAETTVIPEVRHV